MQIDQIFSLISIIEFNLSIASVYLQNSLGQSAAAALENKTSIKNKHYYGGTFMNRI